MSMLRPQEQGICHCLLFTFQHLGYHHQGVNNMASTPTTHQNCGITLCKK